jgi:hypothetical protein
LWYHLKILPIYYIMKYYIPKQYKVNYEHIHWSCYCNVHVYFVIHFVWYSVKSNLCRCFNSLYLSLCILHFTCKDKLYICTFENYACKTSFYIIIILIILYTYKYTKQLWSVFVWVNSSFFNYFNVMLLFFSVCKMPVKLL